MYIATESFVANTTRGDVHVEAGVTIVDGSDEVFWRYPENFKRQAAPRPEFEQATAAPGERRGGTA